ncbi:MAG: hypothetical protein RMJ82_14950 [Gemmatales bacterium]|nr:hypothetical protein [Gemmatales bacterium]
MHGKLVILVPDDAYRVILETLLTNRYKSLGIRLEDFKIKKDALRESSPEAVELLRPFQGEYSHALLVRDLEGSGSEALGAEALEKKLHQRLVASGWDEKKSAVLVVDPEVEAWLRFDSYHLQKLIRDRARRHQKNVDQLYKQVLDEAIQLNNGLNTIGKPRHPKEVFQQVLEHFGVQRSNALYGRLADVESLKGCKVPSFLRLLSLLQTWFTAQ